MLAVTPSVHVLERPKSPNDGRNWHIMTCAPNLERKAEDRLKQHRFDCYLPKKLCKVSYGVRGGPQNRKRKREVLRPIAPGYLFLRFSFDLDQHRRGKLADVEGVHNFLRFGSDYAILTSAEINKLFNYECDLLNKKIPANSNEALKVGDKVRVIEGPFAEIDGDVNGVDANDGLSVLMDILGRKVPVKLFAEQVEKL